jgi:hypothetical protein
MSQASWQIESSVETAASLNFAWAYMSDIGTWDDPPAQFKLDGVFETGGRGTTEIPGQPTRHWQLREVKPPESYTIELPLEGAALSFEWRFSGLADGRTRLTQHITLEGEKAAMYLEDVERAFASNLAPGMNRVAMAIDQTYAALLGRRGGLRIP